MSQPEPETRGAEAWVKNTEAFDRVMSISLSLEKPRTASWVSDEAYVAENTARKNLERLKELKAVTATDRGATTYYPNPAYLRFQEISGLAEDHDRDQLGEELERLKEKVEKVRSRFDVEGPDELHELIVDDEASSSDVGQYRRAISEWETLDHRLTVTKQALEEYDEHNATSQPQAV